MVLELQGEEGDVLLQQAEENFVPLPHGKAPQLRFFNPGQLSLIAGVGRAGPASGGEEVHILGGCLIGHKGHQAPVAVVRQRQARLLPGLPEDAVLGALPIFEFAAHADPFVMVQIALLFHPVEHQVSVAPLQIAEGGIDHLPSPLP